eukprot:5705411-Prymnesium_polylepis.1
MAGASYYDRYILIWQAHHLDHLGGDGLEVGLLLHVEPQVVDVLELREEPRVDLGPLKDLLDGAGN